MQAVTPGPEELSSPWASGMQEDALVVSRVADRSYSVSGCVNTGDYSSFVVECEEALLAAGPPAETLLPRESPGAAIDGPPG